MPIVRNLLAKKLKYGGLNPNGDAEYVAILSNNAKAASRADDGKDAEGYYPQKDYNFRFIDVTSTQYWGGDNADVLLPSKYSYYYAGQRLAARFDVVAQSAKNWQHVHKNPRQPTASTSLADALRTLPTPTIPAISSAALSTHRRIPCFSSSSTMARTKTHSRTSTKTKARATTCPAA